uniref:Cytochrome P450 n=1 Tax=Quercus lobata TaxID=97700 RepID=A0A7N2KSE1_QUELO
MVDKYGSAFNIRLGSHRAFVVSSWEVAKDCFTINDKALASRPATVATKLMGYNYAVMVAGKRYTGSSAASDSGEAKRCQNTINQFFHLMGIFVISDALPFLDWLDLRGHEKAMKKNTKEMDSILGGWLEEHRQRRVSGEVKANGEQDFIDVMLSLQEEGQLATFQYDADTSIKSTCLVYMVVVLVEC